MASTSPLKKYTSYLCILGLIVLFASALASLSGEFGQKWVNPIYPILIAFVVGIQWLVFAFTQKFAQHKIQTLIKQYQIAKFAKVFLYLVAMVIYVFVIADKKQSMSFLLDFIVYYLLFSGLEVWFIQRWMKTLPNNSGKNLKSDTPS